MNLTANQKKIKLKVQEDKVMKKINEMSVKELREIAKELNIMC